MSQRSLEDLLRAIVSSGALLRSRADLVRAGCVPRARPLSGRGMYADDDTRSAIRASSSGSTSPSSE